MSLKTAYEFYSYASFTGKRSEENSKFLHLSLKISKFLLWEKYKPFCYKTQLLRDNEMAKTLL